MEDREPARAWMIAVGALLFAVAFGQLAPYVTNQYTYVLPGFAQADGGPLTGDWLVNTTNSIPLFTAYVVAILKTVGSGGFYWTHGALVALYGASLLIILQRVLRPRRSVLVLTLSLLALTAINSASVTDAVAAASWPGAERLSVVLKHLTEGMAGQPLLRHYHQPSGFGVLLVASMAAWLLDRPKTAAALAAVTPWFHAAYFLLAGVLVASYMGALWLRGERRGVLSVGALALVLVSPALVYTGHSFGGTSSELQAQANAILVHQRFPHHAVPAEWYRPANLLQLAAVAGALGVSWRARRAFAPLVVVAGAAVLLTGLQVLSKSDSLAMLLPWRMFVVLVPVSVALVIGWTVAVVVERVPWSRTSERGVLAVCAALLLFGAWSGVAGTRQQLEDKREHAPKLTEWVSERCEEGDVYLVPPHWAWFRVEAACPIYVDWKSHPYRADEVVEWHERIRLAKAFFANKRPSKKLHAMKQDGGVTHVAVRRGSGSRRLEKLDGLKQVATRGRYVVFEVVAAGAGKREQK